MNSFFPHYLYTCLFSRWVNIHDKQTLILTAVGCMETGNDCSYAPHTERLATARICVFRLYAVPVVMALEHPFICVHLWLFFSIYYNFLCQQRINWIPKYSWSGFNSINLAVLSYSSFSFFIYSTSSTGINFLISYIGSSNQLFNQFSVWFSMFYN